MATWIWGAVAAIILISALSTGNYELLTAGTVAAGVATLSRRAPA